MSDTTPTPFGNWLRAKRISLGWTQDEMAAHLGVFQAMYSRVESGAIRDSWVVARAAYQKFADERETICELNLGQRLDTDTDPASDAA